MASKVVVVVGNDWTELSAAEKGCFENQAGSSLLYWVATTKPATSFVSGHNLPAHSHIGFQVNTSASMKLWARTLASGGDVIVTEY